jgi:hypothetical protein
MSALIHQVFNILQMKGININKSWWWSRAFLPLYSLVDGGSNLRVVRPPENDTALKYISPTAGAAGIHRFMTRKATEVVCLWPFLDPRLDNSDFSTLDHLDMIGSYIKFVIQSSTINCLDLTTEQEVAQSLSRLWCMAQGSSTTYWGVNINSWHIINHEQTLLSSGGSLALVFDFDRIHVYIDHKYLDLVAE